MPDEKGRPLPEPRRSRFGPGRPGREDEGDRAATLSDELAMHMARGDLGEFMQREFGGNENARRLASMMMGMTGMTEPAAPDASPAPMTAEPAPPQSGESVADRTADMPGREVPGDVRSAVEAGDVKGLMEMLRRERARVSGDTREAEATATAAAPGATRAEGTGASDSEGGGMSYHEEDVLGALIAISEANGVSVDWLLARAVKLYIRDHEATGRL